MKSYETLATFSLLTTSIVLLSLSRMTVARPGLGVLPYYHGIYNHLPAAASQQTTVVRDVLGNQGTAYAYQHHNGVSASAVAVSRSDNSKTLAYVPAVAPALLAAPAYSYAHHPHHHHHLYSAALSHAAPAAVYADYNNYVGVV